MDSILGGVSVSLYTIKSTGWQLKIITNYYGMSVLLSPPGHPQGGKLWHFAPDELEQGYQLTGVLIAATGAIVR